MATKEAMVTAPIMVCLWDWSFGAPGDTRRRWPLLAGLAATWVILFALVVHEHRAPSVELGQEMTWRYLLTQAGVVTHYLRLAVVPSPLVFLYTWPMISSLGAVALQAALLTALVVLAVNGVLRRHPLGFAGAWFLLILAPTSSVLPIVTEVAAEHRMYLPLAALVVSAVAGATFAGQALMARVTAREEGKSSLGIAVCALLTVALVVAYGTETRARNRDYWSEERLWQDTVAKQPANQRARVAYGTVLATARRYAEAEVQFRAAVDLAPTDPLAPVRLGSMQAAQGRLDEAIPHFEQALSVRPDDIDAHRFLGEAYAIRRQDALAVAHLQRALAVLPDDATRLTRLAAILTDSRDPSVRDGAKAVDLAEQAVRLTARQDPWPLEVLSAALASVGRYADAAATVNEALWVARAQGNEQLISELEYRAAAYRARQ